MHHLIVFLLFLATFTSSAQDVIMVPPLTQGDRGAVVRIPVTGTISATGTSQVSLSYPADVIRVRSIEGGEQYAYRCENMLIYGTSIEEPAVGRLTFQCDDVVATSNGALFDVVVEVLQGPGTVGSLQATSLVLNGTTVDAPTLVSGLVEALGAPYNFEINEGFVGNYPNPFAATSSFVFQVEQAGTVRFTVLNPQGRKVLDAGSMEATAGENSYNLQTEGWELAQGTYLMQMVTDRGAYLHPFVVVK